MEVVHLKPLNHTSMSRTSINGLIGVTNSSFKSYSQLSHSGFGSYFAAGYYDAPLTDANLSQASLTQTYGTANAPYASHAFIVAGGAGVVDTGVVGLKVLGTRIQDDGTRTTSYEEVLSADITTLATDQYVEAAKFIGQVTFQLYVVSGTPTAYTLDFNYGFAKYEDFGNRKFTLQDFEIVGECGATNVLFNVGIMHHKHTGWTYSAAAFVPGTGYLYDMSTDHQTEADPVSGDYYAYKRAGLTDIIDGSNSEGVLIRAITGANNQIEIQDCHIGVIF